MCREQVCVVVAMCLHSTTSSFSSPSTKNPTVPTDGNSTATNYSQLLLHTGKPPPQPPSPNDPCRAGAHPSFACNTQQFCLASERLRHDECLFLPQFCSLACYRDLDCLAKTDCMEHPGDDPFLRGFSAKVREMESTWPATCGALHPPHVSNATCTRN